MSDSIIRIPLAILAAALVMLTMADGAVCPQRRPLDDMPDDVLRYILLSIGDAKTVANFSVTCKRVYLAVKDLPPDTLIFHPMTPISQLPKLIEDFTSNITKTWELQLLAETITPLQAVCLFHCLLHSTKHYFMDWFGQLRTGSDNAQVVLSEDQVVKSAALLINALNRPEITNMASIFFNPSRILPELRDQIPSSSLHDIHPTILNAALIISETVPDHDVTNLKKHILSWYPHPFDRILLLNRQEYKLLNDHDVASLFSKDPVNTVKSLLGVGIRFEMETFLIEVDVHVESMADILPYLYIRHSWDVLKLLCYYSELQKNDYALALLRSPQYRALYNDKTELFSKVIDNIIQQPNIILMHAILQEPLISKIVNGQDTTPKLTESVLKLKEAMSGTWTIFAIRIYYRHYMMAAMEYVKIILRRVLIFLFYTVLASPGIYGLLVFVEFILEALYEAPAQFILLLATLHLRVLRSNFAY